MTKNNNVKKILVTGANGFVGEAFVRRLLETQYHVIACTRQGTQPKLDCEYRFIKTLDALTNWKSQLRDIDVVVHCAALVHAPKNEVDVIQTFKRVNAEATTNLAEQAKENGVKHFIFISTMGVYGLDQGYITKNTPINPTTAYSKSKVEAENKLRKMISKDFIVTIIRPPMIYGANSKGSFSILKNIAKLSPMFPRVDNNRSAIFIDNLCEFLILIIKKELTGILFPQNSDFLATDETIKLLSDNYGKKIYLSKILGHFVKPIMFLKPAKKAFGSLTYDLDMPGGPNDLNYNNYNFIDSIEDSIDSGEIHSNPKIDMPLKRPLNIRPAAAGLAVTLPLLVGISVVGYAVISRRNRRFY